MPTIQFELLSKLLYNSVDYLNSMKFRINKKMLKFILTEFELLKKMSERHFSTLAMVYISNL